MNKPDSLDRLHDRVPNELSGIVHYPPKPGREKEAARAWKRTGVCPTCHRRAINRGGRCLQCGWEPAAEEKEEPERRVWAEPTDAEVKEAVESMFAWLGTPERIAEGLRHVARLHETSELFTKVERTCFGHRPETHADECAMCDHAQECFEETKRSGGAPAIKRQPFEGPGQARLRVRGFKPGIQPGSGTWVRGVRITGYAGTPNEHIPPGSLGDLLVFEASNDGKIINAQFHPRGKGFGMVIRPLWERV